MSTSTRPSRRLLLPLVAAFSAAAALPAAGCARAPDATAPRLVVVVSVDQMRADYLERFRPLFTGGLHRLIEKGAWFGNARFRHACTETGPGHSVLLSGRSPRSSGIVGNEWYDRTLRRRVSVVEDDTVRMLGAQGRGSSPAHFAGFTVGDLLKARSPRSRVVGISLKDRAAILMAGPRADGAYWYDTKSGRFVSSTYYLRETPHWLESWNARRLADSFAGRPWERLLVDLGSYRRYAGEDAVEGESDRGDTVFPHRTRGTPPETGYYDALRRTPFADAMLLELALAALEAYHLGEDDATDLLAVSFSACDAIGHAYGPDSQEVMDELLRLDHTLGRLLEALDRRAGVGRSIVVLAADHGVAPLPEIARKRGLPGRRVNGKVLSEGMQAALARRFPGASGLLADPDPLEPVLDADAIVRQGLTRGEVLAAIRRALVASELVDAGYQAVDLMGPAPADDPFFPLHQRAFFAPRSGDLIARVKPYVVLTEHVGGTGHGTPHDYDRHVPIVFLGPGIAPGPRDVSCGPEDIAWALGRLLGLDYPQQDAATDLLPLLRQGP